jgi:ankyrin repeat protein
MWSHKRQLNPSSSPLQWALYLGLYEITRMLLDQDANGAHISCKGWNPVLYLLEGVRSFEEDRPYKILEILDILNHDKVHVDTEAQNQNGYNALQLAAACYSGDVVTRLLRLGASISQYGRNPWKYIGNPIWNAINSNNFSAFKVLLEHYPDVDAVDYRRLTMLNYTARNGNIEMVELLLRKGAEEVLPYYQVGQENCGYYDSWVDMIEARDREAVSEVDSECDLDDTDGLEDWTAETYEQYITVLERAGRILIRPGDERVGPAQEIYWPANETIEQWF